MQPRRHNSSKPSAFMVIAILGVIAILSLIAMFVLTLRVLDDHAAGHAIDPATVGFIAAFTGICTGAIGFLGGILSQTEKPAALPTETKPEDGGLKSTEPPQ